MILRRNTCRHVRDQLPLHVGNDLEPAAAERVDAHLKSCLSCFREFRELAAMRGRLGVLAEEPLPAGILDGFTEEVMARIAIGEPGPAADPPVPARVLRPFAWPSVAAAAAVVLVAISAWWVVEDLAGRGPRVDDPAPITDDARVVRDESADAGPRILPSSMPTSTPTPRPAFEPVQSPGLRAFGGATPVSGGNQAPNLRVPPGFDTQLHGVRLPSEIDRMIILKFGGPAAVITRPAASGLELDEPRQPRLREPFEP